jgi:group I intron endonuclease
MRHSETELELMEGQIYIIRNLFNGKGYVGQTRATVEHRFTTHCKNARWGFKGALYSAMRKHGITQFRVTKLVSCDESMLDEMEMYFIRICATFAPTGHGYNLTLGGDHGSRVRKPMSKEVRAKIGNTHRGMKRPPRTPEWTERQKKAKTGKPHSKEANAKTSATMKGKLKPPFTDKHRASISLAKKGQNKGKPWSEARRAAENAKKGIG